MLGDEYRVVGDALATATIAAIVTGRAHGTGRGRVEQNRASRHAVDPDRARDRT
jgi:hypothetical protein